MVRRTVVATVAAMHMLLIGCRDQPRLKFPDAPIVLISIDTLRADRLASANTPFIDRLAADGVLFENAYAHVPLTLPSHVSMLTGRLPHETGVRSNIGYRLEPAIASIPTLLASRGYATGAAVSAYVIRAETGLGPLFDAYDDSLEVSQSATLGALQRRGDDTVSAALRWIEKNSGRPFFFFLHLFEPHSPYEPTYDADIEKSDAIVGRFLSELQRRGIYDDALIILTSDHGEGLGDHGEEEHGVLLYREVLHVPLIVKLPKRHLAGTRVQAPAQHVDLLPTIAKAVGADVPAGLAGVSLFDLGKDSARRAIYSETLYPRIHLGWSELRSLTDDRHHYIESPAPELFDIVNDPREQRDLRAQLRREAHEFAGQLGKTPLDLETMARGPDDEETARLAALGYLSARAADDGPRRNPREHVRVLADVQRTFVLTQERRYVESIDLCRRILRDYPELVDVRTQLAGNLRRLGRLQEARDTYREAIQRSPQLVESLAIEVAKVDLDIGDLKSAELNAQVAMKLSPAEAHLILAAVAMAKRDFSRAEREARLAFGNEQRPRVPALILLAQILVEQNRLDEALAVTDRAERRIADEGAPAVATLASTRGDILARMGRMAEAEEALRQEIARFPTTTEAYARLALLYATQKRFSEITPTLEAMVKASPTRATYQLASRAMSDFGNEAGAREFARRGEQLR